MTYRDVEWFQFFYKHLHPKPTKNEPHLLIVDSHGTHETSELIKRGKSRECRNIFPPWKHNPSTCNHFDRTIFKPFKTVYGTICSEHLQDIDNVVSKVTWPGLFQHAFDETMLPPNVLSGFAATGFICLEPPGHSSFCIFAI